MKKLKLECKGCGYIFYPEKERWSKNPEAPEPDCPNEECPYYGIGFHPPKNSIWLVKGIIDTNNW